MNFIMLYPNVKLHRPPQLPCAHAAMPPCASTPLSHGCSNMSRCHWRSSCDWEDPMILSTEYVCLRFYVHINWNGREPSEIEWKLKTWSSSSSTQESMWKHLWTSSQSWEKKVVPTISANIGPGSYLEPDSLMCFLPTGFTTFGMITLGSHVAAASKVSGWAC